MSNGTVTVNFESTGANNVASDIDALTARMHRFQEAGFVSGQDVVSLRSRAISQSTAQQHFVVSKQAQQLAAAGAKFSQGMSMATGALTIAARAIGDSSGKLAQVAASFGNMGAIGSGALAYLGQGGVLGKLGTIGAGLGTFGAGYGIGNWLWDTVAAPFVDPTSTDEYRKRVARAAEKHRRVNQGRFDAAAFARALEETKTSDEAAAMLKVLENELFERVQKFNLGLDGSRENQDTIVRLEKQIVTLKRKQVTLLSAENAKRQAELSETRGKEIDEIVNDALEDSRERKFAREYDNASAEEKIRMAQERLAQANAASTTALGTLNAMQSDPNVSDEEFNKVKQNLVEANAEIAAFENLLHSAQKEYEAELNARQKEREAKEKAQAKAEWERALGGAYRSNGNSLARNGLMMSSVAPRGIDITAKNTEIIADIAREILRKVDRGTVARAG